MDEVDSAIDEDGIRYYNDGNVDMRGINYADNECARCLSTDNHWAADWPKQLAGMSQEETRAAAIREGLAVPTSSTVPRECNSRPNRRFNRGNFGRGRGGSFNNSRGGFSGDGRGGYGN